MILMLDSNYFVSVKNFIWMRKIRNDFLRPNLWTLEKFLLKLI